MFSMCSELTPRARIPDTRIPQFMQPCPPITPSKLKLFYDHDYDNDDGGYDEKIMMIITIHCNGGAAGDDHVLPDFSGIDSRRCEQ